jgi:hypothetical protein
LPREAKELTALDVRRVEHPGAGGNLTVAAGGVAGLMLQLTPTGGRTWLLRTKVGTARREFGCGSYPTVSFGAARDRGREIREAIRDGRDPAQERKAAKAALALEGSRGLTSLSATDRYLAAKPGRFQQCETQIPVVCDPETHRLPSDL